MTQKWWNKIPEKFEYTETDMYVIMPNHIYGIISITGADPCVSPNFTKGEHTGSPLHKMIQWFKTMSTTESRILLKTSSGILFQERICHETHNSIYLHMHALCSTMPGARNDCSVTACRAGAER
jgi:hypothetical protein